MKKSTHFLLLIVAVLLITCNNLFAQDHDVIWDFPVKPGMEEWKSLNNSYKKITACQVPGDVLPALSTEQLIEVCLNYPLLFDILAFDNILTGLETYSINFNGFRELIERSDAALVLIKKYKGKDPLAIEKDWSSYDKFDYALKISMMELFLCNKQILSKLDNIEKRDLMNEYRLKKSQKNSMIDLYKFKGFQTIYLAIVRLLESENVDLSRNLNMKIVTPYITTGILKSRDVFKEINNTVNNYLLNDLRPISEESTYFEDNSQESVQADVYTPKGYLVGATIEGEMTEEARANLDSYYVSRYRNAILIPTYGEYGGEELSSTNRFNCHGYAWHVSEHAENIDNTTEYRWINEEEIYWQDYTSSSYIFITELPYPWYSGAPAYPAKISYRPPIREHSAIIANHDYPDSYPQGWVISKWAAGPLMCHEPDHCPFYDSLDLDPLTLAIYHLNPNMTGSESILCNNETRTFTTDITDMPEATLTWTKSSNLTEESGAGTPNYTVKRSENGESWVELEINTLSDFYWTSGKREFDANETQILTNQKVDGYSYCYGMQICPGWHCLSVTPVGGDAPIEWEVPPGIYHGVGPDDTTLDFLFPNFTSSVTITAISINSCGTDSRSFYLTEDYWCGYGMTLYPNPASDNVTVTMIENQPLVEYNDSSIASVAITDAKAGEPTTYTIRIYNSQSILLSTLTRSGKSFNIPLINMREGIYIIEVSDGENSYRQQLIVKHN